jgi:predicted ABC-type transport system involved in lysophospholipase L1 biosynthesis ATPase subunit
MSDGGSTLDFRLESARVRLADGSEQGPFDAAASGRHITLVGAWSAYFQLLSQRASLRAGRAEIDGQALASVVRTGVMGLALCDPPLPTKWTVERYFVECAALAGQRRRAAVRSAAEALARFELGHLAKRALESLRQAERRVVCIAGAVVPSPRILCCELPLHRLEGAAQAYVESALERAREGRCSVLSLSHVPALGRERALAERSDSLLELTGDRITMRAPRELEGDAAHGLLVTVGANSEAFVRALGARGVNAERRGAVEAFLVFAQPGGSTTDYERFAVTASGPETTVAVIEAAREAAAPIVELIPTN